VSAGIILKGKLVRTSFIRIGTLIIIGGMLLLALVQPAPGWSAAALAGGWFLILFGGALGGMSNATIMDLWKRSPQTGVILLHGTNSLGKILAPLLVFIVGTQLSRNAWIYLVLMVLIMVSMAAWPRDMMGKLKKEEQEENTLHAPGLRSWKNVWFWLAAMQFAFISGSESGVVSILGSFIITARPAPFTGMDQASYAALVLIIMQLGIVAGRFLFVFLSSRLKARSIILLCTLFCVFAIPGVRVSLPLVYLPSLFLLGVTFSATWPAYFALASGHFPAERSAFAMASRLFSVVGINGCILLSSFIGNRDALIPAAIISSTAVIILVPVFLWVIPAGRKLN